MVRTLLPMGDREKYYHTTDKDCDIIPYVDFEVVYNFCHVVVKYYCATHRCNVCRCGWQVGFHYAEDSRALPEIV